MDRRMAAGNNEQHLKTGGTVNDTLYMRDLRKIL